MIPIELKRKDMKHAIEVFNNDGRWEEMINFPANELGKTRSICRDLLKNQLGISWRLVTIHQEHNGTSESAVVLLDPKCLGQSGE
jgi:hypothetical protein